MSVLSRLGIAASILDQEVKRFFRGLLLITTVAAAGSAQTDATALTSGRNMVTAADGTKGVILPVGEVDMAVEVVNTVSNQDLKVYPNSSAVINAIAADGAFTVVAGASRTFFCDVALHWYVGAGNLSGTATAASTAELDVLDGATSANATTGKAAILGTSGAITFGGAVTAVGSFIIGAADMSEADLEKLDGITDGTVAANKAIVPTTDKHIDALVISDGGLALGAGAGTAILATAAELNRAADVSTRLIAGGATLAVTTALHDGKTILLDTAGGSVCTLPLATATGTRLRFVVTVRPSGASHVIKVGNASDFIAGQINLLDLDAAAQGAFQGDGTADDTITINNTTTGGAIGDSVVLEDTLLNKWTVVGGFLTVPIGSNPADPFSATV